MAIQHMLKTSLQILVCRADASLCSIPFTASCLKILVPIELWNDGAEGQEVEGDSAAASSPSSESHTFDCK